jgi:hypothetical protein
VKRLAAETIRLMQEHEDRRDDDCPGECTDDLHNLLLPGCCSDNPAGLEVLHVVAGNGRGAANDTADDYCRSRAPFGAFAHEHKQ